MKKIYLIRDCNSGEFVDPAWINKNQEFLEKRMGQLNRKYWKEYSGDSIYEIVEVEYEDDA